MAKSIFRSDDPDYLLSVYQNDTRRICKRLTTDRLAEIIAVWDDPNASPDSKAQVRDELITSLLPLVMSTAASFRRLGRDEAIAEGNLMAVQAVDTFLKKSDKRKKFEGLDVFSYVKTAVVNGLLVAQDAASEIIPLGQRTHAQRRRLAKAYKQLATEGKEDDVDALAEAANMPVSAVLRHDYISKAPAHSLDEVVNRDSDEQRTFLDVIPNPDVQTPEAILGTEEGRQVLYSLLRSYLSDIEFQVIARLTGLLCEPLGHHEIAKELGITVSASRAHATRSYGRLRKVENLKEFIQLLVAPTERQTKHKVVTIPHKEPRDSRIPMHETKLVKAQAKLTPEIVREIRARLAAGETGLSLSKVFGVSSAQIYNIRDRKQWKDLK